MRKILKSPVFWTTFLSFIFLGMALTLFGATIPSLKKDFGWSYLENGIVIAAGSISFFVFTFLIGKISHTVRVSTLFFAGFASIIASLAFFARTPLILPNLLLNVIMSAGFAAVEIAGNLAILDLEKDGSGKALNLMHASFAVGAIGGPVIVSKLISSSYSWKNIYMIMAVSFAAITPAVIAIRKKLPIPQQERESKIKKTSFSNPVYWLGFFTLLLYVGAELGLSNWIAEYGREVFKVDIAIAPFLVSMFWTGLLLGRIFSPFFLRIDNRKKALIISSLVFSASIAMFAILGNINPSASAALLFFLAFLGGTGAAIIFPTTLLLVSSLMPDKKGDAIGFATTGGGIGAFVFPFIMSAISDSLGLEKGFIVYTLCALMLTASIAMLASQKTRK
ncbi:MFS transporter [Spirochaetia bacterium 38H-sp]|uniref:MFS transporter n=1 Tax=Rarispira pelagica TaxID=3141764 RepID=A0ABU9UAY0_9SPIR